jgi:hypothetical protein
MKKKLLAFALAGLAAAPVLAGPNVGVSINIHQPGVYGRIDIGGYPQPALVYPEPVVITQPRVVVERRPIYLYVPPAQQTHWRQYCGRYNACGQPVYFVQDRWVRERWEERRAHEDRPDRGHHDNGRHLGHDKHDKHGGHDKHGEGRGRGH